jgi:hypothetical protein
MHRLLVAMLLSALAFWVPVSAGHLNKMHNFSATAAGPGIFRSNHSFFVTQVGKNLVAENG